MCALCVCVCYLCVLQGCTCIANTTTAMYCVHAFLYVIVLIELLAVGLVCVCVAQWEDWGVLPVGDWSICQPSFVQVMWL